jgi:multicopper oxidase
MTTINRRAMLGAGLAVAGSGLLSACGNSSGDRQPSSNAPLDTPKGYISPDGPEVAAAEERRDPGPMKSVKLTATESRLDLGGRTVKSWSFGDRIPGREIRVTAGDTLAVVFANHLPQPTTVHWHGLALRNDMDGVPGVTQRPVQPGASFDYRFAVPHPGTYWLHPHIGVQQDRGLYAPLIVDDPKEPLDYDREWVVVLDDWVDGVDGSTPDAVIKELSAGMGGMSHMDGGMEHGGMPGMTMSRKSPSPTGKPTEKDRGGAGPSRMLMGATSDLLGGDAGDVAYPLYLVNGRTPDDPETFHAKPGDRIRLRLINAGGDTAFRVALGGHRMTVTHTDGYPVEHATTDALLLGMGERYDVLVTVKDGTFPLTALAEGKKQTAMAVLRTAGGSTPRAFDRLSELDGKLLRAGQLQAAEAVRLKKARPDRTIELKLTGSMGAYDWSINGKKYNPSQRYPLTAGERVRVSYVNTTDMWHPMHLHGHTFALPDSGPRKDTAIVLPGETLAVDFDADNPGQWLTHCHNVYHGESGMMTILGYHR